MQPSSFFRHAAIFSTIAVALAACGGSSSDEAIVEPPQEEPHTDYEVNTKGRLVIGEANSASVHVFDLDSGRTIQTFLADNSPSAIYASPDNRYAVLLQRTNDLVQFVDGGIYSEDHGDHLHEYKENPQLLNTRWQGVRPTHFETHEGYSAIFFDGNATANANASVSLLSDLGIGAGNPDATLSLPSAHHGAAEPHGQYLLTTYKDPSASGTSPNQVELYCRSGNGYSFVQRFEEPCPGLHGSYSNGDYTAFGCTDGVLVIHQHDDHFHASKIANPADIGAGIRIGTIIGNAHLDSFIGIASPGHLFAINPAAGSITRINWAEGRTRRAHALDAEGENLLVLDDLGQMHILDTHDWAKRSTFKAVNTMPTAAPFPALVASKADDTVILSNPGENEIAVIDLDTAAITTKYPVTFSPTNLAWVGLAEHDTSDSDHAGHGH